MLLTKSKLNVIKVLISKALIDSNIFYDEFALINKVLRKFYEIKEEFKYSNKKWKLKLYIRQCCLIVWSIEKIQQVKIQKLQGLKIKE